MDVCTELASHARIATTMASKQARKAATASLASAGSIRQEVEKLIEKDRLKDAVKAAKLCFKDDGSPDNHRLLERAYFLRCRQLLKLGMAESAIEVAGHLLEFGLTSDEWADDFVRLLMNLGLADEAFRIQAKSGKPELQESVTPPRRRSGRYPSRANPRHVAGDRTRGGPDSRVAGEDHGRRIRELRSRRCEICRGARCFRTGSSLLEAWRPTTGMKMKMPRRTGADSTPIARRTRLQIGCVNSPTLVSRASPMLVSQILEKEAFGEPVLARLAEMQALIAGQDWQKVIRVLVSLRHSASSHRFEARRAAHANTHGDIPQGVVGNGC